MRTGLTISAVGHATLLAWAALLASGLFAAKPLDTPPTESMPIDIVSATELSQLRAGKLDAPKAEKPKPLVEKIADAKPQINPAQKVVDKPEIVSSFAPAPTPPPEPKVVEAKRPAEAKAEPKPKVPEKKEADKPDPIAEALKHDEAKSSEPKPDTEPKKVEAKKTETKPETKPEPKKIEAAKPQPKFDATRIAALLDKREAQRQASTGDTISRTPALGTRTGDSPQLSASEIDAFRHKVGTCWNPPAGAPNADRVRVLMTIRLKPDRTLAAPPEVEIAARDASTQAMIDAAVRAIIQCQPYAMFSPQRYDAWKEIPLDFNPVEMFGG
jgi:colicin import membrane protein